MNNLLFVILVVLTLNLFSSCKTEENKTESQKPADTVKIVAKESKPVVEDYSGVYNITDTKQCNISITITKENEDYKYAISVDKINYSGSVSVMSDEGKVFLQFNGKIGDNPENSLRALYENGKFTIQNYGNSMNEFIYFKNCDAKYLTFSKM